MYYYRKLFWASTASVIFIFTSNPLHLVSHAMIFLPFHQIEGSEFRWAKGKSTWWSPSVCLITFSIVSICTYFQFSIGLTDNQYILKNRASVFLFFIVLILKWHTYNKVSEERYNFKKLQVNRIVWKQTRDFFFI